MLPEQVKFASAEWKDDADRIRLQGAGIAGDSVPCRL
jgi:hypothetical protein